MSFIYSLYKSEIPLRDNKGIIYLYLINLINTLKSKNSGDF